MRVENDLKPHNVETVNKILSFFETENKCCAIQATGTGKTFLILRLLEVFNDEGKQAIILAPNNEIIKQTKKRMKQFNLSNATFYTYQKLARMTEEEIKEIETDLIVCDELHRTGAATWGAKFEILVTTHPNAKIFGATATALRCTDGRDMAEEYFDNNKACDISLAEALVRKIIPVMPLYVSALYTFEEEYQKLSEKIENGNNTKEEKEQLQKELSAAKKQLEKANGIPKIIKKHITDYNGKYIVFCRDKDHLYAMKDVVVDWFKKSGYKGKIFEYPYYANSTAVKKNLDLFKANTEKGLKLLFVIDKLNEGLHLDEIQGCILLRTTVSNIIYYQQIGRVIDAGTDEKRIILDLVSNFNNLGSFNFRKELQEKIEERQTGEFSECSTEFEIDEFDVVDYVQDCVDVFSNIDSIVHGKYEYWSSEEDEILRKYYPTEGVKVCLRLTNRDEQSCKGRASLLKIRFDNNTWTEEEVNILKTYYPVEGLKVINRLNNRTKEACMAKVQKLNITSGRFWTNEEDEVLKKYFPTEGSAVYKRLNGRGKAACRTRASKLGIVKQQIGTSKYTHVFQDKQTLKWVVYFKINNKTKHFGRYDTEDEAGRVAMEKAKELGVA